VQSNSAGEPNFEKFPEVRQYELKRLLIAPLRTEDRLFGLLTLGRSIDTEFDTAAIEVVRRTARLLTTVLEHDFLQQELLERKLVDRAKGILQQRRKLSDEQAHLVLRRESRHRGPPMIDVAKEIIEKYAQTGSRFRPEVWRQTG
jgi:GAF domain-containing protein